MINYKIPKGLEPEAERFSKIIVAHIDANQDNFNEVDEGAIDIMIDAYNNFIKCKKILSEEGLTITNVQGNTVSHPAVKIMNDSKSQYINICKDYGFTSLSRKKFKKETTDDSTLLESLIGG